MGCNVKMEKFLPGRKRDTFPWIFGFQGRSVEGVENFFMGLGGPLGHLSAKFAGCT